jgi:hypothetical protein
MEGAGQNADPAGGTSARSSGASGAAPAQDAAAGAQPTGSGDTVVRQGESIESIARRHGFLPQTIWDDPDNAQLKRERKDPSMLLPGDRLRVPERRRREEPGADAQRHKFRRKGLPSKLRVKVLRDGQPRANEPYVLSVDGQLSRGDLDGDGVIEIPVPPNARHGRLTVGKDESDQQVFELHLSGLDPIDAVSGVQQRLCNLGYPCPKSGSLDPETRSALADFQRVFGIEATGEPDQTTRDRLAKEHGG